MKNLKQFVLIVLFVALVLLIAACEAAPGATALGGPTSAPVVQTRIVEATRVVSQTVVITTTPVPTDKPAATQPAPATLPPTAVPPTTAPTRTPVPRVVSGFPASPAEVIQYFNIRGINVTDVVPCPNESGSKCWEIKVSPFLMDNPLGCWIEGYREEAGTPRPGAYANNKRSGVPPNSTDVMVDSGITIRTCEAYAQAPTPGPVGLDQSIHATLPGFPDTARAAAAKFAIDLNTAVQWGCGEANCFDFKPRAPATSFNVSNTSGCWQDGYRLVASQVRPGFEKEADAAKISVPPGYSGPAAEIVIRPCK